MFLWKLPFKQSFFEPVFCSSFVTPVFYCRIHMDISVKHSAEANGASAIVRTANLFDAGVSGTSNFCRTPHVHALPSTSAADLVNISSFKIDNNFSDISIPITSSVKWKLKVRQHLATCFHLETTHRTSRQCFCNVSSTLMTKHAIPSTGIEC